VDVPEFLPDTAVVRQDWAEYLAGIEKVDQVVGVTMETLKSNDSLKDTIQIYMSDHGPTFQHGKMTLYDLGLRVPFMIAGPGIRSGVRSDALASELDWLPTITELITARTGRPLELPANSVAAKGGESVDSVIQTLHGKSFAALVTEDESDDQQYHGHEHIFAEISNAGPLPNDGIQERTVFDGRWKLIYRENVEKAWRQVNDDTRSFPTWGNRTYAETIRMKDQYPRQYEILAEMDPQKLHGKVQPWELYDLHNDPDEMHNLINVKQHAAIKGRLIKELSDWIQRTNDVSVVGLSRAG
jgi:N-sulfoglucosamine sulfohydrolase